TMRQFAGFGSAQETNARYKFLLQHGQGGLSVAFDMPTLMGRDSDDPRSEGEVGRCGVATDSLQDWEVLFDGIPLGDITTSMTISGPATIAFAFFLAAAAEQGVDWVSLDGTLQTDILKEYIARSDSDDPRSEGEVGRCGVATDSLQDWEVLFDGIPLGDITTSMTISGPATIAFAFFLAAAAEQGVDWVSLDGTLQTDILKEYIA